MPEDWHGSPYWSFLRGDALAPEALAWAPKDINVLFIDIDPHDFEQTLTALTLWTPRVMPGGVVLLHDTEKYIGAEYITEESGVWRALDLYCGMKHLEWRNRPGCNGLGILRVR